MREGREGLREGGRKGGVINQIVTGPNHARSMLDAKEAFDITASPLQSHGVGVYPGNALISSPGNIHSLRWLEFPNFAPRYLRPLYLQATYGQIHTNKVKPGYLP